MPSKYEALCTQRFDLTDKPEGVYTEMFQIVRNTETDEISMGIRFGNSTQRNISKLFIGLVFLDANGKTTAEIHGISLTLSRENANGSFNAKIPVDVKNFSSVRVEIERTLFEGESETPVTVVRQEDKKKKEIKKPAIIAAAAVIGVIIIAVLVFVSVGSKDRTDGNGIGKVTGKGDGDYSLAETTAETTVPVTEKPTEKQTAKRDKNGRVKPVPADLSFADVHAISELGEAVLVTELPAPFDAFRSGKFYFEGRIYGVQDKTTDESRLAVNGKDYSLEEKQNGRYIGLAKFSGQNYYLDMEKKIYLPVTNGVMTALGKSASDYELKVFDMSMFDSYELYSVVIDEEAGLCMRVYYIDGYFDDVFSANGNIVQINTYNAEGIMTECMVADKFTTTIPDGRLSLVGYAEADGMDELFGDM